MGLLDTWNNTTHYSYYQLVSGKELIFPIEFEVKTLKNAKEVGLDLTEENIQCLQQLNKLDEMCLLALKCTTIIQQQRAKWHERLIKKNFFQKGDLVLLYDSRFQDFPGKLQKRWLGPSEITEVYDNWIVCLTTINNAGILLLSNRN